MPRGRFANGYCRMCLLVATRVLNEVGVGRLQPGRAQLPRDLTAVVAAVHRDVRHYLAHAAVEVASGAVAVCDAPSQLLCVRAVDEPPVEIRVFRRESRCVGWRHRRRPNVVRRGPALDAREPQVFD